MRRKLLTALIAIGLCSVAILGLFLIDLTGQMRKDAALEAYGRSGNNAILPPNSLEARLSSSENRSNNDTAVRFFILVWLRERLDLILTFGICAITGGLLISVVSNKKANQSS
jgi:hypothetical protein